MAATVEINREWIASEFAKGIDAEQSLAADAKATAEAPPDPALSVLYHEIATADERHAAIIETIATRYGHTPSRGVGGGVGGAFGRLKETVAGLGASPLDRLSRDLSAKAGAIHWLVAWVHVFEAIGDAESARELADVLAAERTHCDALQAGLNRLVERGARGEEVAT
jgi:hypothetical protein